MDEPVAAERRIEGWSRAKKIASMAGEFEALRDFAVKSEGPVSKDARPFRFSSAAAR